MNKPELLVSVFFADEVRSALLGGADIIDCEDPRTDVGMYAPQDIADIIAAVRQAEGTRRIRASVNIGASLQLYTEISGGRAVTRSEQEVQTRASQEAIGFAAAMDLGDIRPNIIKFGVDGIPREQVIGLVKAVRDTIRNSRQFGTFQVIGSFLPIDLTVWNQRKTKIYVIRQLIDQGVFYFTTTGSINLFDVYKDDPEKAKEKMKGKSDQPRVELLEPYIPSELGFDADLEKRTKDYVDLIKAGGADGVMIDTPVQAKAARICLLDVPENNNETGGGKVDPLSGLYTTDALRRFTDYCEFKRMEAWTAGSVQPFHAKILGTLENLDVVLCRGSVSVPPSNPFEPGAPVDLSRPNMRVSWKKVQAMVASLRSAL
jgi:hypothetical protein